MVNIWTNADQKAYTFYDHTMLRDLLCHSNKLYFREIEHIVLHGYESRAARILLHRYPTPIRSRSIQTWHDTRRPFPVAMSSKTEPLKTWVVLHAKYFEYGWASVGDVWEGVPCVGEVFDNDEDCVAWHEEKGERRIWVSKWCGVSWTWGGTHWCIKPGHWKSRMLRTVVSAMW